MRTRKEPRRRAQRETDPSVGEQRRRLFAAGCKRIRRAISEGFYIEAICLLESWISDRLESHLVFLGIDDCAFSTLERLGRKYMNSAVDPELARIVREDVEVWKADRNRAAHELMKIEEGTNLSWEGRLALNEQPALAGLRLLRTIDNRIRSLQREKKGEPADAVNPSPRVTRAANAPHAPRSGDH